MYHSLGASRDRYSVTPDRFARQMAILAGSRRPILSLRDAWGAPPSGERPVVVTFDDGFADNYEAALPILRQYGLPATVFLVTDAMGGQAAWHEQPTLPLLDWAQAREMAEAGIELGSHSATHLDLRRASLDEIRAEVARSKAEIEDRTGQEVTSFAYPYGYYRPEMPELLRQAGYRCAVLAGTYGRNAPSHDPYQLNRVPIWRGDSLLHFRAKVGGWYGWK